MKMHLVYRSVVVLAAIALTLGLAPALAEDATACAPLNTDLAVIGVATGINAGSNMIDLTSPDLAAVLETSPSVSPVGVPEVQYVKSGGDNVKISEQRLIVEGKNGELMAVSIECTSSCERGSCTINGCDASASGCSSCFCQGGSFCACTCTKKSTWTPDVNEP